MLSTPFICASIGAATESPTVLESAPGYVVVTWIWTGVMVGYWATGRTFIATSPAMTIMRATTVAKMGRSMKNLENIPYLPCFALPLAPVGSGLATGFAGVVD